MRVFKGLIFLFVMGFMSSVIGAPSMVNGIAFFVNGSPVTLLEVYQMQQSQKVTQDVAVDRLINARLHKEEIKRRGIVVNELEIDDEITRIAKQNKATYAQVKSYVESNGGSFVQYKENIRQELLRKKLYQLIVQDGIRMADEKELQGYYEANKKDFLIPQSIDVVKFYSKDNKALERVISTKGKTMPKGVSTENEVLQTAALNPQIVLSFTQGKIGEFTPIFPVGDTFMTFLIKAKNNPSLLPYENVRNVVLQKIMQQKEDYLIYEYFEKLRSNAKVNIVRLN